MRTATDNRVTVFGPNPLLSVTIEARADGADDVHLHAAGQGVWVARTAGELGALPELCGFIGGETGAVLEPLLARLPGSRSLVRGGGATGCYVVDHREGDRRLVAQTGASAPDRHELDDLVSRTCASAVGAAVVAICNPYPAEALPVEVYAGLVADAGALGPAVIADLSSPRLDAALTGGPHLVKLNDWELAEFVTGPVEEPEDLGAAVDALQARGARDVIVTRGERSAVAIREGAWWEIVPPRLARGWREGCGDAMFGALAAAMAEGLSWEDQLRRGAAAGAAAFLRRGLGSVRAADVRALERAVELHRIGKGGVSERSPRANARGASRASHSR